MHRRTVLVLPFTACLLDPACLLDIGPQAYARHPVSEAPEKYTASGDLRRVRTGSSGIQECSRCVPFVSESGVSAIVVLFVRSGPPATVKLIDADASGFDGVTKILHEINGGFTICFGAISILDGVRSSGKNVERTTSRISDWPRAVILAVVPVEKNNSRSLNGLTLKCPRTNSLVRQSLKRTDPEVKCQLTRRGCGLALMSSRQL